MQASQEYFSGCCCMSFKMTAWGCPHVFVDIVCTGDSMVLMLSVATAWALVALMLIGTSQPSILQDRTLSFSVSMGCKCTCVRCGHRVHEQKHMQLMSPSC